MIGLKAQFYNQTKKERILQTHGWVSINQIITNPDPAQLMHDQRRYCTRVSYLLPYLLLLLLEYFFVLFIFGQINQ